MIVLMSVGRVQSVLNEREAIMGIGRVVLAWDIIDEGLPIMV